MEKIEDHMITSAYGNQFSTYSSNEVMRELKGTDLSKLNKRIDALYFMIYDWFGHGRFEQIVDGIEERGGAEALIFETLYDMMSLCMVLKDEADALKSFSDGQAAIIQGLAEDKAKAENKIDEIRAYINKLEKRYKK